MNSKEPVPLFVDLDGTLVRSDLLWESLFLLLKLNWLYAFSVFFWLLKGKAHLKKEIAARVIPDVALLPYNESVLKLLKQKAAEGRPIYLATASHERIAHAIAAHLGIFRAVLASADGTNLSGANKLHAITTIAAAKNFDYAANDWVDLKIWSHAKSAILVNPRRGLSGAARRVCEVEEILSDETSFSRYLKAIRVHQWLKNLLVFVPLLTAHQWLNVAAVMDASLAFVALSLCASAIYLLNDLLDLPSDRRHPRKRERPFASGAVPLGHGVLLCIALALAGLGVAATLSPSFLAITAAYLTVTTAYSFKLKTYVIIDAMTLAGLYTLRVIAGAIAIQVAPSFWLLAFSMFIFLSLALVKRCSELRVLIDLNKAAAHGRDYRVTDLQFLQSMGVASGYLAVMVLAFFINSAEVIQEYNQPQALWLICPLVLYWVSRVWLKAGRGEMHDDPIVFAVTDRGSRYIVGGTISAILLAVYLPPP